MIQRHAGANRPGRATADVVVIGAGIAGLSAAWALATDCSVVVVEQEPQPAAHATGRSAAVLSETVGLAEVCALAVASRQFLESPPEWFAPVPLVRPRGLMWVSERPGHLAPVVAAAGALGVAHQVMTPLEAAARVPVLRPDWLAEALLEPDAMAIDVSALVAGYRSGLIQRGGRIELGRGAMAVRAVGRGWEVSTSGGETFSCGSIVNAAGAWADYIGRLAGLGPLGLQPYRRTAFVFAASGQETAGWPLVTDAGHRFYFEPEAGGLLASPAEETPVEPHDARADEMAMARAVDALGEATTLEVRGVRSRWAGLRTFAPDRLPVAGQDPRAPGFFWLAAQGGGGIKTAPALAELTRSLVQGDAAPSSLDRIAPASLAPDRLLG